MKHILEICCDSIASATTAQEAGARRIELCSCLPVGGITPSYGLIRVARENLSIGINVLIRPRGGDFLYGKKEIEIMKKDIDLCRECGINGIVTGALRRDGSIDTELLALLAGYARPMTVTFHRAFDLCSDPVRGLSDLIACGVSRLLTSGQKNTAEEGSELIRTLVSKAGDRIVIMPGGGITADNIRELIDRTGASEFHMSAGKNAESLMEFRRSNVSMGNPENNEYSNRSADSTVIRRVIEILASY